MLPDGVTFIIINIKPEFVDIYKHYLLVYTSRIRNILPL